MPRREQIVSPAIEINQQFIITFDDGSSLIVKRNIYGYRTYGNPELYRATKEDLDGALSAIAEDRGGNVKFS